MDYLWTNIDARNHPIFLENDLESSFVPRSILASLNDEADIKSGAMARNSASEITASLSPTDSTMLQRTYTLRLSGIKRTREIATSARRQWYVRVSASQFLQFTPVRLFVTGYTAGYLAKLSVIANLPPHLFKSSVSVYFASHRYYCI